MSRSVHNSGNIPAYIFLQTAATDGTPDTTYGILDTIQAGETKTITTSVSGRSGTPLFKYNDISNYPKSILATYVGQEASYSTWKDSIANKSNRLFSTYIDYNGTRYCYGKLGFNLTASTVWNFAVIDEDTIELIPYDVDITVTNNIPYTSLTTNPSDIVSGNDVVLNLTANTGYYITSAVATCGSNSYNFNISDNTATVTISNVTENITISGNVELHVNNNVSNTTLDYSPKTGNITFTITANDGYHFESAPTLDYVISTNTGDTETVTINFTLDTNTTATLTIDFSSLSLYAYSSVNGEVVLDENVPTTTYKFINVYNLTSDELESLAQTRFEKFTQDTGTVYLDLGYYITSLKRFYCTIPTAGNVKQNIVLADVDTGVNCLLVSSDFIELNCGSISIDRIMNNSNDFNNVSIEALLPFIGNVTLDTDKYMNRTISLKYKASVISGKCIAIFSDENDIILDTFTGEIAEDIPYILNNVAYQMNGTLDANENILYGFIPYIYLTYRDNFNEENTSLFTTAYYTQLSNLTGLTVIDHVNVTIKNITNDEIDMLIDVLQNGVIF